MLSLEAVNWEENERNVADKDEHEQASKHNREPRLIRLQVLKDTRLHVQYAE